MKRLIILILLFIPFITSCKSDNDKDFDTQIREIAWNSLNEQQKATVTIDWKKSTITETTYQDKAVYAVSFKTSQDPLLGPIIVYVDKTSLVVLGQALRM